jgi:zinc transporter 1
VNGVFLIALCMTIILDAISRFFDVQEVQQPQLVLGVGAFGLAFNILGLFVFHQHDHGSHEHEDEETGHAHSHDHEHDHAQVDGIHSAEEEAIAHGEGETHDHDHEQANGKTDTPKTKRSSIHFSTTSSTTRSRKDSNTTKKRPHSRSYSTIQDLPIHPAALRHDMRVKARFGDGTDGDTDTEDDAVEEEEGQTENSPLLAATKKSGSPHAHSHSHPHDNDNDITHSDHNHATKAQSGGGHGHDHDDNLRGMFLHVLGDALGNVGVMAAALIIWLSDWKYRFYVDPAISLFITLIILKSAIPLVKDTARPLLQATPDHLDVGEIRADISKLPGVVGVHHMHVWALTRSKLIATLDVQLNFDFTEKQGAIRYMQLAREIKKCLKGYKIHSSTVQPEFCVNANHAHSLTSTEATQAVGEGSERSSSSRDTVVPYQGADTGEGECCLLSDDQSSAMQCCPPPATSTGTSTPKKEKKHDHEHGHSHGHDHGHEH